MKIYTQQKLRVSTTDAKRIVAQGTKAFHYLQKKDNVSENYSLLTLVGDLERILNEILSYQTELEVIIYSDLFNVLVKLFAFASEHKFPTLARLEKAL
jgi:hypothetical protein